MANYSIRNTRNQIIANVADTTLDTTTAVYLVGRNYSGYGIYLNDNSVRLMENFASNTAPSNPLEGQLWYNTGVDRMKWWDGVTWKQVQSTEVSDTNPTSVGRQDGDQWYDITTEQLKIWNASPSGNVSLARWDTIGPQYTAGTPKSGVFVETIYDAGLAPHYVLVSYANGSIVTILNPDAEFTPTPANVVAGFDTIKRGLQMTANIGPYTFAGTANNSIQLNGIASSFYVRSNAAVTFSNIAPVTITSNTGLTIGEATTANVRVDYSTGDLIVQNIANGGNVSLFSRSSAGADVRALYINSGNVILNDDPLGELHAVTKRYVDVRVAATNQNIDNNVTVLTSYITAANASIDALQSNAATQQSQINLRATIDSPALTGTPTAPTPAIGDNDTSIATTAFVFEANAGVRAALLSNTAAIANDLVTNYAPLASPALIGVPVAPTAAINANTTQISTTAFVSTAVDQLNSTVTSALSLKAPLASPALTGVPVAPTAAAGTNTTQLATTAFVFEANAGVLARVLANTGAVANDLATNYAPKASPALTGVPTAPTASSSTNTTQISTTAFVSTAVDALNTVVTNALSLKAPLASPALTGNATAPTATAGTNTTQLATTAFVFEANAGVLAQVLANTGAIANNLATNYALKASPALTGVPTAPTASTNTNTTQIATTAFVGTAINALNSNVTSALNLKAPLASPALTGTPTAPNASVNANSAQIATTSFVQTALSQLFSNTFANTGSIANSLNDYARLLNPTFTGAPLAPNASVGTNTAQIATTAFVGTAVDALNSTVASALSLKAPLASPALTGTPTAPNANVTTDTTQVATTGFVHNILTAGMILMWSGSVANIPFGWALCNGANGTPDLRNRFIVGAGNTYAVGATGGTANASITVVSAGSHSHGGNTALHTLTIGQMPSHTHTSASSFITDGGSGVTLHRAGQTNFGTAAVIGANTGSGQGHSHTINSDGAHSHTAYSTDLPPYYALCYIMKTTG
jgi:hypothetical protein